MERHSPYSVMVKLPSARTWKEEHMPNESVALGKQIEKHHLRRVYSALLASFWGWGETKGKLGKEVTSVKEKRKGKK